MLALDVAVHLAPPPDRLALLSGYALLASAERLPKLEGPRPAVLVSNGRADTIVPFERAELMRGLLEASGFAVTFAVHDGGHGLEAASMQALEAFLASPGEASASGHPEPSAR